MNRNAAVMIFFLLCGFSGCASNDNDVPTLPWQIYWQGIVHRWEFRPVSKTLPLAPHRGRDAGVGAGRLFLWGDFDGDGRRDYVVNIYPLLTLSNGWGEMRAYLCRGWSYKPFGLGMTSVGIEQQLDIVEKGTSFIEANTKNTIYCENDCIRIISKNGSAKSSTESLFKYEHGAFRQIGISEEVRTKKIAGRNVNG